ncbi:hypothetical protein B566_EDAN011022 [Ephemera danica]|nr:hypothetical protein B566_EDAN011022 [Ephemera danica]
MTLAWQHPFTSIIAGPTSCEIIWCYGESQPMHDKIRSQCEVPVRFIEGIPDLNDVASASNIQPRLIIIDDLMREANGKVESFADATSKPHSYLLFDMKQNTPDAFRFRTDIFPGEANAVYVPKNVTTPQLKRLSRHKRMLRRLAKKGESWKKKKQAIVRQSGGFLLPLLAPILGTFLSSIAFNQNE